MIDSEKLIGLMRERVYKPLTEDELVATLSATVEEKQPWRELIARLEKEGRIIKTRYGRYGLPEMMNLAVGKVLANAKGFAFLSVPGREEDIFLSASSLNGAMHGDRVVVRLNERSEGRKDEGEVIRILERATTQVVGRFEGGEQIGFCVPDDRKLGQDIVISPGGTGGAKSGDKVVVRITQYPHGRHAPTGVVETVLGRAGDPGVDVLSVVHQYQLSQEFPEAVLQQVAKMPLTIGEQDLARRRDLRGLQIVTIDGPDAKDLDDAISVEILENGNYRLGVHIADVSHYVTPGSPLDKEAFERGTSVYLLDRVLPMLPKDLSNGICSLNPRVDRLTLSVFLEIDQNGKVQQDEVVESVIRTEERMTYEEVNRLLEGETGDLAERYREQLPLFKRMKELRDILLQKRTGRGAIDFEVSEAKVILDEDGKVLDIVPRSQTVADSIIEEFMVAANEAIAERFHWLEAPFIYRVHEEPKVAKITELNQFLGAFGLRIKAKADNIHPRSYQAVLDKVEGRLEQRLIHRVLLRSMMRARYSPECLGHFGLAAKYYCHFTAPIRRYPDLVIHRIIKEHLRKKQLSEGRIAELTAFVDAAAIQSSEREQVATEAERAVVDMKKVEFMQGKEGEVFPAIISGVASFGFFAELDNTVEGLVHVSTMADDFYQFDDTAYALIGKRTKRRFRLGDRVQVKLINVNLEERRIDFELAEEEEEA
ncbi:MAG: ribonuclease R [Bacillota bacterium]